MISFTFTTRRNFYPFFVGFKYYSKIIAVDSAGLRSDASISDGVVVDSTPPQSMKTFFEGPNLLRNPSFESTTSVSDVPGQFPLTEWNISAKTKAAIVHAGADVAQDGVMMASVFGSISQTITTETGQAYQISFYVSHTMSSRDPLLNQEGYIQAPGLSEVFKLYNRPAHTHSSEEQAVTWLRHTFYFTAHSEESVIALSSVGRSNGVLLDNVKVDITKCWKLF